MMAAVFQNRIANRMFTMISYARSMMGSGTMVRKFFALMLLVGGLMWSPAAQAQNCAQATTQGTAPASWQTYCWLNLGNYNDTTARSTTGQNMTFTLPDGSVLSFNARVTGTAPAYNAVIAPSWSGAAVGNSAFIGIPGRPVLYSAQSGTSRIAISNITVSPPAGGGVTVYSFVVADAESSNDSEALRMSTNGGAWQLLDSVPPISGSVFPPIAGVGTSNGQRHAGDGGRLYHRQQQPDQRDGGNPVRRPPRGDVRDPFCDDPASDADPWTSRQCRRPVPVPGRLNCHQRRDQQRRDQRHHQRSVQHRAAQHVGGRPLDPASGDGGRQRQHPPHLSG
jgi:hypothetical protein